MLAVGAVKAALEDGRRWMEDRRQNRQLARVLRADGSEDTRQWRDVHVGDILLVRSSSLALIITSHTASVLPGRGQLRFCLVLSAGHNTQQFSLHHHLPLLASSAAAALLCGFLLSQVRDGEEFPADLVCLSVALPEGICYVQTANLGARRRFFPGCLTVCWCWAGCLLPIQLSEHYRAPQ